MTISVAAWSKFISRLKAIDDAATKKMAEQLAYVDLAKIPEDQRKEIVDYAYRLTQRFGEASAAISCEVYDALQELTGERFVAAVPAATQTYKEVAKAVNGTLKTKSKEIVASAVGRMVRQTGANTILNNAIRDGAEIAFVPRGETCAYCLMMASRGWRTATKSELDMNGQAVHIHANCDCFYAVRFDGKTVVAGYKPEKYLEMWDGAEGGNTNEKLNFMRRQFYQENRKKILEQKRSAYERAKALESSKAEEADV